MGTKENKWCVYIHRNKINNKSYIGITSRKPEERWGNDGSQYSKGRQDAFRSAIKKYGWDNFEHIVWEENISESKAKYLERLLIALFKTNCAKYHNPSYGYNLTDGGDGTNGYKHTDEAREKMSKAKLGTKPWNTGMKMPEEYRLKLSEAHKGYKMPQSQKDKISNNGKEFWASPENKKKISGENHPNFGKHLSEETKKKIGNAHRGRKHSEEFKKKLSEAHMGFIVSEETKKKISENNANKRQIVQLTLDGEYLQTYNSLKEAEKCTGVRYQQISACVRHIKISSGGFMWLYEDEYDPSIVYKYKSHKERLVVQLTKDNKYIKEYSSISEASNQTGFSKSSIGECCSGRHKYSHGYIFMYKENYEKILINEGDN